MHRHGNEDKMKKPAISMIILADASGGCLAKTIDSLRTQTFQDYEALIVGSTEKIDAFREFFDKRDERYTPAAVENADRGMARNRGLSAATGEYILFLNSGDILCGKMLEELYRAASGTDSDIAVCDFQHDVQGRPALCKAVNRSRLAADKDTFCYRDCPDDIMRVLDSCLSNKLFRKSFLQSHALKFKEHSTSDEFAFTAICAASAEKIASISKPLLFLGADADSTEAISLADIKEAVFAAAKTVRELPYGDILENAVLSFIIDSLILSLTRYVKRFSEPDSADFYQMAHDTFNGAEFECVTDQTLHNQNQYLEFAIIRKHGYETMKRLISRRIIVSLTSYPRRIGGVAKILESIYTQTRKPDEVILWLAEDEFPGKEADLPQDLITLIWEGKLCVRWCDNLKPHKKYFYALQEYVNDVVVTIDDDLLYPKDMLEKLYRSYLLYPEAVSAVRTHLILISEQNTILPYNSWPQETDTCINEPCMQLLATSGAGTLFPPNLLDHAFFDKEAIRETCPIADDLWLKAAEAISNVPVVLARPYEQLQILPNSQEEALYHANMRRNQNDVQLSKIIAWTDRKFGAGTLIQKLKMPYNGVCLCGIEAVSGLLDKERKTNRNKRVTAERKLQGMQETLKNTQKQLQRAEEQNLRVKAESDKARDALQQSKGKPASLGKENTNTRAELHRAENMIPVRNQLAELGKMLRSRRPAGGFSPVWCLKYFIYLLAWVPERILSGMMYCLKNGFSHTMKQAGRKLFGNRK